MFTRFWRHFKITSRGHFLTGLLVIVPLGLTYYVVGAIVGFMDGILAILPRRFHPDAYLPFRIPGLGILFTFVIIQLVGILSANLFGRAVVRAYERILDRIPLVRGIYAAVKQVMEQFVSGRSDRFRRVVLIEYPRKGIYAIAFVTGAGQGEIQEKTKERVLNVFLPTTPNPTSGFLLLVPEPDVINLDMGVEQAFKLIISGGMVSGTDRRNKKAHSPAEERAPETAVGAP